MQHSDYQYTLSKAERISLQSRIDLLFTKGDSFIAYPLRVVYTLRDLNTEEPLVSILTSVSKRKFKRAVKRNRVKRLIRENFRLQKYAFHELAKCSQKSIDIAFLYLKDELPEYEDIEKSMLKTIAVMNEKLLVSDDGEKNNS